jgi:preprotein translocase subunit YajC
LFFASILPFLQAGAPAQPSFVATLLPLLLIVVVMYFLMIRPQQKKQKQHRKLIESLKSGDEIVTTGGIYGTVAGVDEKKSQLFVKISGDVKIKIDRFSVARVVTEQDS